MQQADIIDAAVGRHPTCRRSGQPRGGDRETALLLLGGGAYGAFAWGVIDALLDETSLHIGRIVGTGTGALNAVMLACGLSLGGAAGARRALRGFWRHMAQLAQVSPLQPALVDPLADGRPGIGHPAPFAYGLIDRLLSPVEAMRLQLDPLRGVLARSVDLTALAGPDCPVRLALLARRLRDGTVRTLENDAVAQIGADAVLAAATAPRVFQSIEIEGESYCSLSASPTRAIERLDLAGSSVDLVIVCAEAGQPSPAAFPEPGRLLAIAAPDLGQRLRAASCAVAGWDALLQLHEIGRRQAERRLAAPPGPRHGPRDPAGRRPDALTRARRLQ